MRIEKTFIEDQGEVKKVLAGLRPTGERTGPYSEILEHPKSGERWERYIFELEDDHTDAIGLRRYPHPSIEEAINIAITSEHDDEADGAAGFLLEHEHEGEFRRLLLERLEEDVDQLTLQRFELIYYRAELFDPSNKRLTLGKRAAEIRRDHDHFVRLAERAETLKTNLADQNRSARS